MAQMFLVLLALPLHCSCVVFPFPFTTGYAPPPMLTPRSTNDKAGFDGYKTTWSPVQSTVRGSSDKLVRVQLGPNKADRFQIRADQL